MPFSQTSQISAIVGWIQNLNPSSILDVGAGMGQYGFLLRIALEDVNLFQIEGDKAWQRPKGEWQYQIDGIEGFAGYMTPVHEWAYNRVMIGDALTRLAEIPSESYELVIAIDILEHFDVQTGTLFLSELRRVASKAVLISTPKTFCAQDVEANPYENHRSVWSDNELADAGFDELLGNDESWIAAWRRSRPVSERDLFWAGEPELDPLAVLFKSAFGHESPPVQWRWKYSNSEPWGAAIRQDNRLLAFYGGMPRMTSMFGSLATAVLIGDVMVEPAYRSSTLKKKGPLFLVTSAYFGKYVGPGKPYVHAFGFPTARHLTLGEKLGLYERIDDVLEGSWPSMPYRSALGARTLGLRDEELPQIDRLWEEMAADLKEYVVPVRDASWAKHRFMEHPLNHYTLLLVRQRLGSAPIGLLVLRDQGENGLELLDLVAPRRRFNQLIKIARRVAGKMGRHRLFAVMTTPVSRAFEGSGIQCVPTEFAVPVSAWQMPREELDRIKGKWWLMGGDTDCR